MMIKELSYAMLVLFMLASTVTVAETVLTTPTLQTIIEATYQRYPDAALPNAIRQQSNAIRLQASSLLAGNPTLVARHENDELTDNFGFRDWGGSVQMPLWLPGQRKRRFDVADATEQEAAALIPFYKWRVSGEVRELLWSIKLAAAETRLAQTAIDSANALATDINKRVQAGELAVTDQILAHKEALARKIELATVTANLAALRSKYHILTGFNTMPHTILEPDIQDDTLLAQHPALIAASQSTDRARTVRDRAQHEKRANPTLAVGARNERAGSGQPYDTILALELNLPLGLKSHSAPVIANAQRQLTEQQVNYARVQRELEKQRIIASNEKQRTAHALKLTRQQQLLAAEGLRLARRAFELGESDLFTLLQARTQALAAERDLQLRQLEQGRAIARYNQALGVIPE